MGKINVLLRPFAFMSPNCIYYQWKQTKFAHFQYVPLHNDVYVVFAILYYMISDDLKMVPYISYDLKMNLHQLDVDILYSIKIDKNRYIFK